MKKLSRIAPTHRATTTHEMTHFPIDATHLSCNGHSRGWKVLLAASDGRVELLQLDFQTLHLLLSAASLVVCMLDVFHSCRESGSG